MLQHRDGLLSDQHIFLSSYAATNVFVLFLSCALTTKIFRICVGKSWSSSLRLTLRYVSHEKESLNSSSGFKRSFLESSTLCASSCKHYLRYLCCFGRLVNMPPGWRFSWAAARCLLNLQERIFLMYTDSINRVLKFRIWKVKRMWKCLTGKLT